MIRQLTSVSLPEAFFDVLNLPLLHFEVVAHRLIQYVRAIAVEGFRDLVESIYFVRIQSKADRLLVHSVYNTA